MRFKPLEDAAPAAIVPGADDFVDWQVQGLGVEAAWEKSKGAGILIAVLDTGYVDHPNLNPNIAFRVGNPDAAGHASHVTGICAAADIPNGMSGVAPEAKVASIQVLPGNSLSIALGLAKAVELGADVVNMSLGAYENDDTLAEAITKTAAAGVVMCAAGGNGHPTETCYPAKYPEVIAVTALDASAHEAWFAPNLCDIMSPNHFAMPGVQILSTWLNGQYAKDNGTSMATPILTGIVALILAIHKPAKADAAALVTSELVRISKAIDGTTFKEPMLSELAAEADAPVAVPPAPRKKKG